MKNTKGAPESAPLEQQRKYSNNLLNNTLLVIFSISFTAICFFLMAAFITGINLIVKGIAS